MKHLGAIRPEAESVDKIEHMPVVHRQATLSYIRQQLEKNSKAQVALKRDLTPGEAIFQENLNAQSK